MREAPELVVLSLAAAESYEPTSTEICISITNPKAAPARLSPRFAAVLRLCFSDIAGPRTCHFDVLFDESHAAAICEFVSEWPSVDRIVVHCLAGISRSPAVAMGLCDRHGWPTEDLQTAHPQWNTWVRSALARWGVTQD